MSTPMLVWATGKVSIHISIIWFHRTRFEKKTIAKEWVSGGLGGFRVRDLGMKIWGGKVTFLWRTGEFGGALLFLQLVPCRSVVHGEGWRESVNLCSV